MIEWLLSLFNRQAHHEFRRESVAALAQRRNADRYGWTNKE